MFSAAPGSVSIPTTDYLAEELQPLMSLFKSVGMYYLASRDHYSSGYDFQFLKPEVVVVDERFEYAYYEPDSYEKANGKSTYTTLKNDRTPNSG